MKPVVKPAREPLRSSALRVRRFTVPAGASAHMSGVSVLFTSIDSMLFIETDSASDWLARADVKVQSAGGSDNPHRKGQEDLHTGHFHGVENAHEIRDPIQ